MFGGPRKLRVTAKFIIYIYHEPTSIYTLYQYNIKISYGRINKPDTSDQVQVLHNTSNF